MTNLPLPPSVLYAGLAGCVLALIVATVQNRWSLRVFFLLALRLAIGWHFLFEGLGKIHSHAVGPTETNKPFTSEPYFRDADGPLGALVRQQIGDPEELLRQKTEPSTLPAALAGVTDPHRRRAFGPAGISDEEFANAVPVAVRAEWDRFTRAVAETYRLREDEKARLTGPLTTAALAKYGRWVVGVEARDSKVKYITGDTPLTAPQRLEYLRIRSAELDELLKRQAAGLGNGYGHEMARIKEAKAVIASARSALLADADALLAELKGEVFAALRDARMTGEAPKPGVRFAPPVRAPEESDEAFARRQEQYEQEFAGLLPPSPAPDTPTFESLPASLQALWNQHYAAFTGFFPSDDSLSAAFGTAKARFVNWYYDRDEFDGSPRPGFGRLAREFVEKRQRVEAARAERAGGGADPEAIRRAEAELAQARTALLAALDAKANDLWSMLAAALPATVAKGPIDPPITKSAVEVLDQRTMWFITAVGVLLLLGLFTPVACLMGAAFLLATYLTHPPFPWLPLPPGTEGTPVFVNKNLIEMLALLTIAVHPTGRWMGLDAIWHRYVFRKAGDPT